MDERDIRVDSFKEGGGLNPSVKVIMTHIPTGQIVEGRSKKSEYKLKKNLMEELNKLVLTCTGR